MTINLTVDITIILALIVAIAIKGAAMIKNSLSKLLNLKKRQQARIPNAYPSPTIIADSSKFQSSLDKPWFSILVSVLIVAYLLDEVLNPGEVTRMSVFKIVSGVISFYLWAIILVADRVFHKLMDSDQERSD